MRSFSQDARSAQALLKPYTFRSGRFLRIKCMAKLRKSFLLLLCCLPFLAANAQTVEVIDFPAFESRLANTSDTLFVYNFWATWCRPCVEELPYFERLNAAYANHKVKVVLVSLDFPNMLDKQLIPFIQKNEVASEVILLDAPRYNEWIDKIDPEWSGALPATLITVNGRESGGFIPRQITYEELESAVKAYLPVEMKP
jgi:thiol-disulfide isomerase/thioredoxin